MVEERWQLIRAVRLRQIKFFCHLMKREELDILIITVMRKGSRGMGILKSEYLDGLVKYVQES